MFAPDVGLLVDLRGAVGPPQVLDGSRAAKAGVALQNKEHSRHYVKNSETSISTFWFNYLWLTKVLRLPLLSPATETETEREKHFPGDALLGLLDIDSWEPDKLRSRASPETPDGMDEGLRVVCIL